MRFADTNRRARSRLLLPPSRANVQPARHVEASQLHVVWDNAHTAATHHPARRRRVVGAERRRAVGARGRPGGRAPCVARIARPPPWAPTRASAAVGTPTSRPHRAGAKTRSPMRTARNRRGTSWPSDRRDGTLFRSGRDVPATVVRADLWCASLPDRNHRFCQLSFLPRFQTQLIWAKSECSAVAKASHGGSSCSCGGTRVSGFLPRARRELDESSTHTPSRP